MNEKHLNILYKASLEFGVNWRRPLTELADERLPKLSQIERIQLCEYVKKARENIEKYIDEHFDSEKGFSIPEAEAIKWIKQNYPWMNKKNILHGISQGIYYAWNG